MDRSRDAARIVRHDTVDSTSERAFAAIAAGSARHMDVHVAREQTLGRGRLGRAWHSAADTGLFASFVLTPERPWNAAALTMALGLAVLDSVRALGLARATLKWPNDVVVDGAKLAGVLAETRDLDPHRPRYVAGIGVNVTQHEFPRALTDERAVTSLASCGVDVTIDDVLRAVVERVPIRCAQIEGDVARLETDFVEAAGLRDVRARLEVASGVVTGTLLQLSVAHGLVIQPDAGPSVRHALEHVRALKPL